MEPSHSLCRLYHNTRVVIHLHALLFWQAARALAGSAAEMTATWQRLIEVDQYTAALQPVVPPFVESLAVGAAGAAEDTSTKRKAMTEGTGQPVSAKKAKAAPRR
jgi:hypothetical protein